MCIRDRAITVQDLLVEQKVNPDRLLSRGYGNWFMVYPKAITEEKAKKNRRVEVIISSCDSTRILADDVLDRNALVPKNILSTKSPKAYDRYYDEATVLKDIEKLPESAQKDLRLQVEKMKKSGMNPRDYTYKEILSALPGLPAEK